LSAFEISTCFSPTVTFLEKPTSIPGFQSPFDLFLLSTPAMTKLSYKWRAGASIQKGLRAKFLRSNSPRSARTHRSSFPARTPPPANRHSLPQNFASMNGNPSNTFSWRHTDDVPYHERTSPAENRLRGGSDDLVPLATPERIVPPTTHSPFHRQVTPQGVLVTSDRDGDDVPLVEGTVLR